MSAPNDSVLCGQLLELVRQGSWLKCQWLPSRSSCGDPHDERRERRLHSKRPRLPERRVNITMPSAKPSWFCPSHKCFNLSVTSLFSRWFKQLCSFNLRTEELSIHHCDGSRQPRNITAFLISVPWHRNSRLQLNCPKLVSLPRYRLNKAKQGGLQGQR